MEQSGQVSVFAFWRAFEYNARDVKKAEKMVVKGLKMFPLITLASI